MIWRQLEQFSEFKSEKMNLLYFSTIHILTSVDPRLMALYETKNDITAEKGALKEYQAKVLKFYEEDTTDNPIITKVLICLHFLESLQLLEEKHNGFDYLFTENIGESDSFLAVIFYGDFSIESKRNILYDAISEEEFGLFLAEQVLKYIPDTKRVEGELDWLPMEKALEKLNTSID